MIDSAVLLLLNGLLLMLRISPGDSFPRPLSAADEQKYLALWTENGDVEARNVLVEHNLRLVAHIMKKYYTQTDDVDDLISIGTIGLIKGINTYRADKGVRLDMADKIGSEEICGSLRGYMEKELTPREAAIITLRYGLNGMKPKTQRETAELCGISRSYVSRIEKRALEKLREALGEEANPG